MIFFKDALAYSQFMNLRNILFCDHDESGCTRPVLVFASTLLHLKSVRRPCKTFTFLSILDNYKYTDSEGIF